MRTPSIPLLLLVLAVPAAAQTSYPMITHVTPVAVQRGKSTEVLVAFVSVPAPDAGEIAHVTPWLVESLLTVAVNVMVEPAWTVADPGATTTLT